MNAAHTLTSRDPAYRWGASLMLLAAGIILTALGFEFIGRYAPCPLCLQQRWAYYAGIPIAFAALAILATGKPKIAGLLFFAVALGFLANAGLGVYHAGAEWGFWPGPQTCASQALPLGSTGGGVLGGLDNVPLPSCDKAPLRVLGLSFAGWNVVASMLLMMLGIKAAFAASDR
jgi:disulfide bond formation protein DsbB